MTIEIITNITLIHGLVYDFSISIGGFNASFAMSFLSESHSLESPSTWMVSSAEVQLGLASPRLSRLYIMVLSI